MPRCTTRYFETVDYEETAVVDFPTGLPGFENERRFLSLEQPAQAPLVFLQSLTTPALCFVALPAAAIDPSYELEMEEGDLELLGLDARGEAAAARGLLTLAIVTIAESGMTANLLAPIVINTANLRAVQAISPGRSYSHLHPLGEARDPVCS
jgi:flagellar assembly factor FliW